MWSEILRSGFLWLKPPSKAHLYNSDEVRGWMWAVAIIIGVNSVSLTLHILLACGLLPWAFPGFANASDIRQVQEERRAEREADLESQILATREKQCSTKGAALTSYTVALQKLRIEYNKVTNREYPLPSCEGFGKE